MQAIVIDTEVMADLVEDCSPDLPAESSRREPQGEVGLAEDRDLVGHGPKVVIATVGKHYPFIKAEQVAVLLDLGAARMFLDYDPQVVDLIDDPLGQLSEDVVYYGFELGSVHGRMVSRRCYTPGRSRTI